MGPRIFYSSNNIILYRAQIIMHITYVYYTFYTAIVLIVYYIQHRVIYSYNLRIFTMLKSKTIFITRPIVPSHIATQ